jgi:hypothetical protein
MASYSWQDRRARKGSYGGSNHLASELHSVQVEYLMVGMRLYLLLLMGVAVGRKLGIVVGIKAAARRKERLRFQPRSRLGTLNGQPAEIGWCP